MILQKAQTIFRKKTVRQRLDENINNLKQNYKININLFKVKSDTPSKSESWKEVKSTTCRRIQRRKIGLPSLRCVWVTFLVKYGESTNHLMINGSLSRQTNYQIHQVINRQTLLTRNDFTQFLNDSDH